MEVSSDERQVQVDMAFMHRRICPKCGSYDVYPSARHKRKDTWLRLIGIRPYRCHDCNTNHYGRTGMKRVHIQENR